MKVEMQPRGAAIYKKLKKILEKETAGCYCLYTSDVCKGNCII